MLDWQKGVETRLKENTQVEWKRFSFLSAAMMIFSRSFIFIGVEKELERVIVPPADSSSERRISISFNTIDGSFNG
jgi:hypothetical protein